MALRPCPECKGACSARGAHGQGRRQVDPRFHADVSRALGFLDELDLTETGAGLVRGS